MTVKLNMDFNQMAARIDELEAAIRKHRDAKGHDRCWLNNLELYKLVGSAPGQTLPTKDEFLKNCAIFYEEESR